MIEELSTRWYAIWTRSRHEIVVREQLERNMDALRAKVRSIPEEIARETAAIRARFADPQPRMFPVAVTFLVPRRRDHESHE